MGGGGDYGVFADGRYYLNERILALKDWLDIKRSISAPEKPGAKGEADETPEAVAPKPETTQAPTPEKTEKMQKHE
jgi:hypothetical protein